MTIEHFKTNHKYNLIPPMQKTPRYSTQRQTNNKRLCKERRGT